LTRHRRLVVVCIVVTAFPSSTLHDEPDKHGYQKQ
jgi:hypothetical protein